MKQPLVVLVLLTGACQSAKSPQTWIEPATPMANPEPADSGSTDVGLDGGQPPQDPPPPVDAGPGRDEGGVIDAPTGPATPPEGGVQPPPPSCFSELPQDWTCDPEAAERDDGCEDNNRQHRAVHIDRGDTVHGVFCVPDPDATREELDYFTVDLLPGCATRIALEHDPLIGNLDLAVVLPSGERIKASDDDVADTLEFTVLDGGRALLEVSRFDGESNTYRLSTSQQCPVCDGEFDDIYEENDSVGAPAPTGLETTLTLTALACDEDTFLFGNDQHAAGRIRLEYDPSLGPLSLALHYGQGEVAVGTEQAPGRALIEAALLDTEEDYVVRVAGATGSPYVLHLERDELGCIADEHAPNHARDGSAPLFKHGEVIEGIACNNQSDYFRVESTEGCVLAPVLRGKALPFMIEDVAGQSLGQSDEQRVEEGIVVHHEVERTGTYFLRTYRGNVTTMGYELDVREYCPQNAPVAQPGQSWPGSLPEQGYAMYAVNVRDGCALTAEVASEDGTRVDAYLFDGDRLSSTSGWADGRSVLRHVAVGDGGRLLRLHLSEGARTEYTLALDEQCPATPTLEPTEVLYAETFNDTSHNELELDGWVLSSSNIKPETSGPDESPALDVGSNRKASRSFDGALPGQVRFWVRGGGRVALSGSADELPFVEVGLRRPTSRLRSQLTVRDSFLHQPFDFDGEAWHEVRFENIDWAQQRLDIVIDDVPLVRGYGFLRPADSLAWLVLETRSVWAAPLQLDDVMLLQ